MFKSFAWVTSRRSQQALQQKGLSSWEAQGILLCKTKILTAITAIIHTTVRQKWVFLTFDISYFHKRLRDFFNFILSTWILFILLESNVFFFPIEWFVLEDTPKIIYFIPSCQRQGQLPLDQILLLLNQLFPPPLLHTAK